MSIIHLLDRSLAIFLKWTFGVVGTVNFFAGGMFFITSMDLASNDVPDRSKLEEVAGEICLAKQFGRRHFLVELCETSGSFILRRESGRTEAAASLLQPKQKINMLVKTITDDHAIIFEVHVHEDGLHWGLSTTRQNYRNNEILELILGLAMLVGGVWMGWFLRRSVK